MRNSLAIVVFGLLAAGSTANSESLTVSKVDLPVDPADEPFCVSLPEDGKLIAFQSARAGGYGQDTFGWRALKVGAGRSPIMPVRASTQTLMKWTPSCPRRVLDGDRSKRRFPKGVSDLHFPFARSQLDPATDFLAHTWPYEMPFRGFDKPGDRERIYSNQLDSGEYTRRLYIDEREHPYTTPPAKPYHWIRSRCGGESFSIGDGMHAA